MLTESPSAILRRVKQAAYAKTFANANDELFRQYLETTPLGILVVDGEATICYVNDSLCACFGYRADELLGKPIEILVPDSLKLDHIHLRDAYVANPANRLMQGRELRGRRKDGSEVNVAIGLNPLIRGENVKVACTVMDLSQSRRAEETLSNFFDLSLDWFCIANTDGNFLKVNPNFTKLLGYSEEELLSRPFYDVIHPDDIASTHAAVEVLVSGKPVVRFRNRNRTVHGSYLWLEWNARVVSPDGTIFAAGRDVTAEVNLQKELAAREERERAILENTPAVVYVKGVDGKYLYVNQRFVDLFSLNRPAVLGKTDYEIFPVVLADKFRQNDRQVAETGRRLTIEEKAPHLDGLHTYVSTKFPLLDSQGHVSAVAGISTDITEDLKNQEIQGQLKLATAFQRKLYPLHPPSLAGFDLAGSAIPAADLCGDYYDFIVTGDGRLVIAVGDVSGHGLGPALAMVEVRSVLRGLLNYRSDSRLSDVLLKLNQLLYEDLPEARFVSLFLARIDITRHEIEFAGAGHQAVLVGANGNYEILKSTAPVIGLLPSIDVHNITPIPVSGGDALLICTDGVTEAANRRRQLFGIQRAAAFVAHHRNDSSEQILHGLFSHVIEYTEGQRNVDDMTAVVAKLLPMVGGAACG